MKRFVMTLDEDMYDGLRHLALEKSVPMAKLVRFAIDKTFEDELDGFVGQRNLHEHLKDPSGSMTIQEYMASRGIEEPRR